MEDFILSNTERMRIFKLLCEHKSLPFNTIARLTASRSNKLSYQLRLMKEKGFITHHQDKYMLSPRAQQLIPYFSQIFKKEVGVLPVVLGIVRQGDNILLIQRRKLPYKGYWGLFAGKQICGEAIPETIEREIMEESSIKAKFVRYNAVVCERLRDHGFYKHSFLFIVTTVEVVDGRAQEQQEGKVQWFRFVDVLAGNITPIIPSDLHFIKSYHDQEIAITHTIMEETDNNTLVLRSS